MNADLINAEYKEAIAQLIELHGGIHRVPRSDLDDASERLRARFALLINSDTKPEAVMRNYSISSHIAAEFADLGPIQRSPKRSDRWKAIMAWLDANVGRQTNAYELAEIGGISASSARQMINDRVDLFQRIKKGVYEIRSREQDRAAGK